MISIAILGAGGHGRVVAEAARLSGWRSVVLFDDDPCKHGEFKNWTVAGDTQEMLNLADQFEAVHVAIGSNKIRAEKYHLFERFNIANIIHPSSIVSHSVHLGSGTCVLAYSVLAADAAVGNGVILNNGSTIDHDCTVDNFVHICPGVNLAGGVVIGQGSFIGVGSSVIEGVTVGYDALVGAGSVVVEDIPSSSKAYGNPCRLIQD